MAAELGVTIWDDGDLSPRMHVVSGALGVALALIRRLQTGRGTKWYDREYGTNLCEFIHQAILTPYEIEQAAEAECAKDERVDSVEARAEIVDRTRVELTLKVESSQGPFELVLAISDVTVEKLRFSEAA